MEIVNVRVRATLPRLRRPRVVPPWPEPPREMGMRRILFGSALGIGGLLQEDAPVYWRPSLHEGTELTGPAVIEQYDTTTLVPPGWAARVDDRFNLFLEVSRT